MNNPGGCLHNKVYLIKLYDKHSDVLDYKKTTMFLKKCFFIFYILLGLIFNFCIVPFDKPDELTHFTRSLMLSYFKDPCGNKKIMIENKFSDVFDNPVAMSKLELISIPSLNI